MRRIAIKNYKKHTKKKEAYCVLKRKENIRKRMSF